MEKLWAVAMLVSLLGCGGLPSAVEEDVEAGLSPVGLFIVNGRAEPIYYFPVERQSTALIDWIPCTDPAVCDRVDAGSDRLVPFEEIAGWEDGDREVVLYWWGLVPDGTGGFRPDRIRSLVVGM